MDTPKTDMSSAITMFRDLYARIVIGNLSSEYSLCGVMIEIRREVLSKIAPNDRKPTFQAGYLLGKKETVDNVQKVVVVEHFNSLQSGKGTVVFFSPLML
ncbi:MAG: hypothetical protein ACLR23_03900 [Clostridia bacterium]